MSDRFEYVETEEVLRFAMAHGDPRRYAVAFAIAAARESLKVYEEKAKDDSKLGHCPKLRKAVDVVDEWVRGAQNQRACLEAYKTLQPIVAKAAQWDEQRGKDVVNPPLAAIKAVQYALQAVYGQQPPSLMAALASREASTALAESRRQHRHIALKRHRQWLRPELPYSTEQ